MNLSVLPVFVLVVVVGAYFVQLGGRVNRILIQRHPTTWRRLQDHPLPRHAIARFIRKREDLALRDPELSKAVEHAVIGSRSVIAALVVVFVTYGLLLKLFAPGR